MFVVFGTWYYGFIDRVHGLGAVRTRFFHVFFVPVYPLHSEIAGHRLQGLHWRSVAAAYIRAALLAALLLSAFIAYDSRADAWSSVLACLISGGLLLLSHALVWRADFQRARAIIEDSGLPQRYALFVEANYGIRSFEEIAPVLEAAKQAQERAVKQDQAGRTNHPW